MNNTDNEYLKNEVSRLEQIISNLKAENEDLKERLYPYERYDYVTNRLEAIVDIMFPRYSTASVTYGHAAKPLIHHLKNWWWNGASIDRDTVEEYGDQTRVMVSSYVGGGSYDDVTISFPTEFIDLPEDQLVQTVTEWIINENKIAEDKKAKESELKNKLEIQRLQAELEKLQNK